MVRLIRRLRGLQIDHHFKFARLLDWQFGRLCAFKNPCRLRPPWRDRARTATTRAVERIRRTCERAGHGRAKPCARGIRRWRPWKYPTKATRLYWPKQTRLPELVYLSDVVIRPARQQKLQAEAHVAACRELSCRRIRDAG
jgi:hypothetical protein